MEAVDDYMANMLAYPGRTFGQLYHRFFRVNELAQGKLQLTEDREIDLAEVTEPVLVVAGKSDVLAPVPAVLARREPAAERRRGRDAHGARAATSAS